ncbi:hypothetical protein NMG60_11012370 [Bertholletia excelsa]
MGRTSRWFRSILGGKKSSDSSPPLEFSGPLKQKRKWGFVTSSNGNDRNFGERKGYLANASSSSACVEAIDSNKHAIAVAAATAAVAEAALAAAQAAAEVVRLTGAGGSRPAYANGSDRRREWAAVKIQSAFRAYLARRALGALKGLVRLQALVRGHIVRKQSADMLRRMQAMARIQARACANRVHMSESTHSTTKYSQSEKHGLVTSKKYNHQFRAHVAKSDRSPILKTYPSKTKLKGSVDLDRTYMASNWLEQWMEESSQNNHGYGSLETGRADDERIDKILEVDTWKPQLNSKRSEKLFRAHQVTASNCSDQGATAFDTLLRHSTKSQNQNPSVSSGEVLSLKSLNFPSRVDQAAVWTGGNSPQVYSASSRPGSSSSRRGPITPARSECSRSFFGEYMGYPNYMANTESSRAKVRPHSAPRQRMPVDKLGPTKRYAQGFWDSDAISERGLALHTSSRPNANWDRPRHP